MSEYARANGYQWTDTELCMVIDAWNGETQRISPAGCIVTFPQALDYVKNRIGWEDRMIIVKLNCVAAHELGTQKGPQ